VGAIFSLRAHNFWLFLGSFLILFVATGVGNGSVYRMIPAVFRHSAGSGEELAVARRAAAGCLGIAGAVGAFGGFMIPRGFATSTNLTGGIESALWAIVGMYAVMLAVTWVIYARRGTVFGDVRI
jgi:NNP family nitrate/nitrite transporter-like MFS transporter